MIDGLFLSLYFFPHRPPFWDSKDLQRRKHLRRLVSNKLREILLDNKMTTSSNLASDATQMLAAALEQMDDIIAGM